MKKTIVKMCLAAMFLALTYLLTTFAAIPYAGGQGYLNFGDAAILLASAILGPWWGALVGAAGAGLADLTLGGVAFIPFTIIAKGGEAIIAGFLVHVFKSNKTRWLSFLIGTIWMVLVYMFCYWILYGYAAMISTTFDLVQAAVATIVSSIVYVLYSHYSKKDVMALNQPFFHHKKKGEEEANKVNEHATKALETKDTIKG